MKRIFDIVCAVSGLVLMALPMLAIVVVIRRDRDGGALFAQQRIGRGGRPFTCYKFRTMHTGTAQRPTHEAVASDVTEVGRVLRRTKLDELPQLWNVLTGDMSLVGPRPCLTSQHELIAARRALGVDKLLPGITGLAQVNGIDMSSPGRLAEVDALYAREQCAALDLRILIATVTGSWRPALPLELELDREVP